MTDIDSARTPGEFHQRLGNDPEEQQTFLVNTRKKQWDISMLQHDSESEENSIMPVNCNRSRLSRLAVALLLTLAAPLALADNLQQIFTLAAEKDPEIRQARARYNASHTVIDQGRSQLLPSISATASTSRDTTGVASSPLGRPMQGHSFGAGDGRGDRR